MSADLQTIAEDFVTAPPHRALPYSKRNWGGTLHSLCSYQGKLKPSIAHFLVSRFTEVGDRVLDPMAGVGTIPLEARLQGREGLAGDLSPLAAAVSKAKLEVVTAQAVTAALARVETWLFEHPDPDMSHAGFGLNGPIADYFHERTLREVIAAREYFRTRSSMGPLAPGDATVMTAMLHILHGNRPYALSRRSHSLTPFAPTGPTEYKSVSEHLARRLSRTLPLLEALGQTTVAGRSIEADFRDSAAHFGAVDAVITSPPFTNSFRFWSTNWMRLWFSGWDPENFKTEPSRFLESEQRKSYEPYTEFSEAMSNVLRPGGTLILHLGETAGDNMVDQIVPLLEPRFHVDMIGREKLPDAETHGLRDKGATYAHWYLFARRR